MKNWLTIKYINQLLWLVLVFSSLFWCLLKSVCCIHDWCCQRWSLSYWTNWKSVTLPSLQCQYAAAQQSQWSRKSHQNSAANNATDYYHMGNFPVPHRDTFIKTCTGTLSCNIHEQTHASGQQTCNNVTCMHGCMLAIVRQCDGVSGGAKAKAVRCH